jgi:hypothetical protein
MVEDPSSGNGSAVSSNGSVSESFPSRMNKDRALYGSLLTDKVRRAVPPTINT